MRWNFLTGPWQDGPDTELTTATGRRVTVRLNQPADAGFTLDGRHEQALGIVELATDLWCYRDRVLVHRGRIGASSDTVTETDHTCTFTAPDYRALLDRRFLHDSDTLEFTAADQADIGWQLIAATQTRTAGDLGITRGTGQTTGYLRDRLFPAGKPIGEALSQLGDVEAGFDWEIDPQLRFNVYTPTRGHATDVVLDYGGTVMSFSRDLQPSDYANSVRATAASDPRAPEERQARNLALRPEGLFEREQSYPDIIEQATLAAKADHLLEVAQTLMPTYTLNLADGAYPGPEALWVGDTALVRIRSGRLVVDEPMRVVELVFEPGPDGAETVRVSVGRPPLVSRAAERTRTTDRRLAILERRATSDVLGGY